ncbi:MAG: hypothetical protein AABX66_00440, partial [Nanoarchaeota archaeon]
MTKVMNTVFGIGIAVLLFIVVLLGTQTFYPAPTWEQYNCTYPEMKPYFGCTENMTIAQCNTLQVAQINSESQKVYDECNKRFNDADRKYGKVVFFVSFIVGIIIVIISMFLLSMTNIAAGTAFAGLALIVYGFIRGWPTTNDTL